MKPRLIDGWMAHASVFTFRSEQWVSPTSGPSRCVSSTSQVAFRKVAERWVRKEWWMEQLLPYSRKLDKWEVSEHNGNPYELDFPDHDDEFARSILIWNWLHAGKTKKILSAYGFNEWRNDPEYKAVIAFMNDKFPHPYGRRTTRTLDYCEWSDWHDFAYSYSRRMRSIRKPMHYYKQTVAPYMESHVGKSRVWNPDTAWHLLWNDVDRLMEGDRHYAYAQAKTAFLSFTQRVWDAWHDRIESDALPVGQVTFDEYGEDRWASEDDYYYTKWVIEPAPLVAETNRDKELREWVEWDSSPEGKAAKKAHAQRERDLRTAMGEGGYTSFARNDDGTVTMWR